MDPVRMDHELTLQQAREIARLRRRHPGAQLLVHQRPWGVIVEARRGSRTVELERFDFNGATMPDRSLRQAA
jgi:hypothetical protein